MLDLLSIFVLQRNVVGNIWDRAESIPNVPQDGQEGEIFPSVSSDLSPLSSPLVIVKAEIG